MTGQNGELPEEGAVLWAWVAQEKGQSGVARLQQAWLPLGTINLAGFNQEVLADQRLLQALQEQADKDGQTVRLVKFVKAEEVLAVRPRSGTTGPNLVEESPGRT